MDAQGTAGVTLSADHATERRALQMFDAALDWPPAEREARLGERLKDEPAVLAAVLAMLRADRFPSLLPTQPPGPALPDDDITMPERIGQYRVIEEIGRGGMGLVYRAERDDGLFDQQVAIKVIRRTVFSLSAQEQFAIERRILARLHHPHIAQLLDGGIDPGGASYIIMELIRGVPITDYAESRALSLDARLDLYLQACSAIEYAHRSLVIHADVKPGNVVVAEGFGVKLLDFGIARLVDEEGGGHSAHTPGYTSPARLSGERSTPVDDIFALGVLLHDLVAQVPGANADLLAIAAKAAEADVDRRYGAVSELVAELERWRRFEPVSARPPDGSRRLWLWWKRNRLLVSIALALAATSLITGGLYLRAEAERAAAEQRFAELRSLADFLLSDAIAELEAMPGSGPLRQRTALKARGVLENLRRVPGAPLALRIETANAYRRVGEILSAEDLREAIDPAVGDAVLASAEAQLRAVATDMPDSRALRLPLAQTLVLRATYAGVTQTDRTRSFALLDEAERLLDAVIAEGGPAQSLAPAQLARMECDILRGYVFANSADYAASRQVLSHALERGRTILPQTPRQRVDLALQRERAHTLIGDALWYGGDKAGALVSYRLGVAEFDQTPPLPPDVRVLKRQAYGTYTVASSMFELGERQEALRTSERGLASVERLRMFDSSASARRMENIVREEYGLELQQLGRLPEAITQGEISLAGFRESARLQPNNYQAQRSLPAALRPLGELYRDNGNLPRACALFREAGAIWTRLAQAGQVSQFDRENDVAQVRARLGKCPTS